MFKPCFIIPVYNHEKPLIKTLQSIEQYQIPCIVINDGSAPEGSEKIRQLAYDKQWITLIEHSENMGKGAAIKTGLKTANNMLFSHALQVDCDGQHNLNDIDKFLTLARANPNALISGAPIYDESVPKARYYARYITHVWVWINSLSFTIKDSMCGFRVYPVKKMVHIIERRYSGNRMEFDTEIMVRAHWNNVPILTIPTRVKYPEDGVSHFNTLRDNVLISKMHARLFAELLIRWPILLFNRLS